MNIKIRLLLALALFAAIVFAGIGAPAWADKLNIGAQAPAASGLQADLPVGIRPQGSVVTTGEVVTLTSDQVTTVGSCATVLVKTAAADIIYTAYVVPEEVLPKDLPADLISCAIKIEAKPGTTLGAEVQVCFPIPPSKAGFAYDSPLITQWVKTTLEAEGGQSCVTIPATTASPAFAGLFDK